MISLNVVEVFPLYAETWGTVSDWFMVCVTGLTAVFLWKTLKSQTKVQEMQQGIADIEKFKHKLSIKPKFDISAHRNDNKDTNLKIYFKCLDFEARNIIITSEYGPFLKGDETKWVSKQLFPNSSISITLHSMAIEHVIVQEFKINFEDVEGSKYSQSVFYFFDKKSGFQCGPVVPNT